MTTHDDQVTWEKTINMLLGDKNPCNECIVRATCTKSFTSKSACDELAESLQKRIDEVKKEKHREDQN
jgi:hypothetical protein